MQHSTLLVTQCKGPNSAAGLPSMACTCSKYKSNGLFVQVGSVDRLAIIYLTNTCAIWREHPKKMYIYLPFLHLLLLSEQYAVHLV